MKSRLNDFEEHLQSSIRIRFSTYSESTYLSSWTIRQGLSQGESRQGSEEDREEEHDEECQVEEEVGLTDSSEEGYPLPTTQHRKATHYPRPSRGRLPTTQQWKTTHDPRPSREATHDPAGGRLKATHDPAEEGYPRPSRGRLPTTHDPLPTNVRTTRMAIEGKKALVIVNILATSSTTTILYIFL